MGKSPAKWIKGVLFGKKSSRSHASKGREVSKAVDHKEGVGEKGPADSPADSPVISKPLPVNASVIDLETDKGAHSSLTTDGAVFSQASQHSVDQGAVASVRSDTSEKIREEQAAVKAQAAFRGYLARRAFRALRGIIRLQALIRGHLVRRQAVATLHCMQGIVKLQSQIRGRRVRISGIGGEVYTSLSGSKVLGRKVSSSPSIQLQKTKYSGNVFVHKLFLSKTIVLPLRMQYAQGEPNSVLKWLERWSFSHFWKPLPQPKKIVDLKSQVRNGGYAVETESGRPKRSVRRNFSSTSDSAPANSTMKRNFKKINSSSAEVVQEHPQSELEKVKRNLRKISNPVPPSSEQADVEVEKPKHSVKRTSSVALDVPELGIVDSTEKVKKNGIMVGSGTKSETVTYAKNAPVDMMDIETAAKEPAPETELHAEIAQKLSLETKLEMETTAGLAEIDTTVTAPDYNNHATDIHPLHDFVKEKTHSSLNKQKLLNEAQVGHENQKATKRRASLSDKTDYPENGLQNTPPVPSYMAATESAKAKLRGQSSPRLSSDGIEKNGYTRRHSLPSSTGGKQRQVQASGRGGIRNEKPFSSSKDGPGPIQVEWRR